MTCSFEPSKLSLSLSLPAGLCTQKWKQTSDSRAISEQVYELYIMLDHPLSISQAKKTFLAG
jgi:hypothetical protein